MTGGKNFSIHSITHRGVCVAAIAEGDGKIREKFCVIALGGWMPLKGMDWESDG